MTEAEWLVCTTPEPMLTYLRGKVSDRKLRLFACACCWRVAPFFPAAQCQAAVLLAERVAEGEATEEQRLAAAEGVNGAFVGMSESGREPGGENEAATCVGWAARWSLGVPVEQAARTTAHWAQSAAASVAFRKNRLEAAGGRGDGRVWAHAEEAERQRQADLLREVVGRPSLRWRTSRTRSLSRLSADDARQIAHAIWTQRDFAAVPILADALEEAGCADADVLDHLRGPGPHVRGCWALDLVLDKS